VQADLSPGRPTTEPYVRVSRIQLFGKHIGEISECRLLVITFYARCGNSISLPSPKAQVNEQNRLPDGEDRDVSFPASPVTDRDQRSLSAVNRQIANRQH